MSFRNEIVHGSVCTSQRGQESCGYFEDCDLDAVVRGEDAMLGLLLWTSCRAPGHVTDCDSFMLKSRLPGRHLVTTTSDQSTPSTECQ